METALAGNSLRAKGIPYVRIVSMVPSWTETLLTCGADVIGRTRFCIHPAELVRSIPAVGGTKDIDWEKLKSLKPDLLILDREENPKDFAELAPCPFVATHVTSVNNMRAQLQILIEALSQAPEVAERLEALAAQWELIASEESLDLEDWEDLPGVTDWITPANKPVDQTSPVYMIWREPWMAVTPKTFIGSMLEKIGVRGLWPKALVPYPEFDFSKLPKNAVLLASSEPFPFAKGKFREELKKSGHACAIVDGECFSWFGVRALEFLEEVFD